ncbi:MAG: hypothetical protein H7144_02760 [Burkholderiales bacterium]|nr:hypothetical protein [Phycisphaerae bacterium]
MSEGSCKGCVRVVNLAAGEVDRLVSAYFAGRVADRADDDVHAQRLTECDRCPDLTYGTTCRHCGCLVAVRTRISGMGCPAPVPRWNAIAEPAR